MANTASTSFPPALPLPSLLTPNTALALLFISLPSFHPSFLSCKHCACLLPFLLPFLEPSSPLQTSYHCTDSLAPSTTLPSTLTCKRRMYYFVFIFFFCCLLKYIIQALRCMTLRAPMLKSELIKPRMRWTNRDLSSLTERRPERNCVGIKKILEH